MKAINDIFNKLKSSDKFKPLGEHGTSEKKQQYLKSEKGYTEEDWTYRVHNYIGDYAKPNGYSSFHCGFMYGDTPIEIHIETKSMFMVNNFGSADHNGVYKSRPQITDFLSNYDIKKRDIKRLDKIIRSLEMLDDKSFKKWYKRNQKISSMNIKPNSILGRFTKQKENILPLLIKFLEKHNLSENCLTYPFLSNPKQNIMNVLNRYYLHELIVLHANSITDDASLSRACNNLKAHLPHGFPLDESVNFYYDYLGIEKETKPKTTDELLKECISHTNPILYKLDGKKLIPTTMDIISRNIGDYYNSVTNLNLPNLNIEH